MPAELIDSLVADPVLVVGSLPPSGRDLDLLVRPPEERRLVETLPRAGFISDGEQWIRFGGCSAESVDLVPAAAWHVRAAEADALFAEARPVPGYTRLVRPAPAHAVLILARQVVHGGGLLKAKRRARLDAALAEQGDAWEEAESRAPLWGAPVALAAVRDLYEREQATMSWSARVRALAEWQEWIGTKRWRARARACRATIGRTGGGRVVALSGLDGSGKTFQAEALCGTLERLGFDAAVEWTRLEWSTLTNPVLGRIAAPVKAALRWRRRRGPEGSPAAVGPHIALRERSALVAHVWVTIIALVHAAAQRRATRGHLRRGRIVVCDRYTLDAAVDLHDRYGERRDFGRQVRLVRALSPTPMRTYLLEVRPESALARKQEQFSLRDLERHQRLFERYAERLDARRVDGEREREEICAELARDVWIALRTE